MASPDSKKIYCIENIDRISQLPESMILNILSRLPLKDSARTFILSKTWKSFCSLYPILYFDHNLFALQSLVSAKEGDGMPDINQIRDMFMDGVDYQLSGAMQLDSPIRKLALTVAINDSMHFYRVDKWMELVRQITVEDFCITMQSLDFMWEEEIYSSSVVYEFPLSVLVSRGLRSAYVQGCKLGCETLIGDPINNFFSLQRLCLSHVFMDDHALENLIRCCQGIQTLVLDNCSAEILFLIKLSKFPKLKKADISLLVGKLVYVDIVDTHLECFSCHAYTKLIISPDACAGIRELNLAVGTSLQPDLLEDLTAAFPVLEEGKFYLSGAYNLKAVSNVLRKLTFWGCSPAWEQEVHIECPSLTLLHFRAYDLSVLYVDCPKLRVFNYCGSTIPACVFFSSMANLEERRCDITMHEACDTLWLVKLRAFLILVGNAIDLKLTFRFPIATFEPEKVEASEVSSQYNVHLTLVLDGEKIQDIAALMNGLLWIIRPTTLTVRCRTYDVVKYLCENLLKKQEDNICDEQLTRPCWMHQLEDFQVECPLDVPVTKNNLAAFPEQCVNLGNLVSFKFSWCLKQD